ncbi:MAG: 1,4-dihydroxy-2-naphthoate polyprenyltransferase [Verrucomicrobia bacterium]|nr:1,4-dihydroxy-2-naphthoate polyprenyltransferase [Verrucomicrobiota bacterium]MDA1068722.1 1,4-dihydroxy-2-naphthoate polyprenyltransferase [Verrucomicrobiota bacterium]
MVLKPWILAARPKTLPAAMAPVLVGTALAYDAGGFRLVPALICFLFALLIQIATNFANDYFDFKKGADTADRVGPTRAVAAGLIKPETMKRVTGLTFAFAFCIGLGLIPFGGWWLLAVGVTSVLCGYAYTAGPYPLAYIGLGDLFVMIFFGIIAVCCTFFVQTGYFSMSSFLAATAIGGLSTNLLVINNLRDIDTDKLVNKRTLATRFGRTFSIVEYHFFMLWSLIAIVWMAFRMNNSWVQLPMLTIPLMGYLWIRLGKACSGDVFNSLLAKTALLLVLFSATLCIGLLL